MSKRRYLIVSAVVLVILLSGCVGPLASDDPNSSENGGEDEDDRDTLGDSVDYPWGWDAYGPSDGVLGDENPLLSEHSVTYTLERDIYVADTLHGDFELEDSTEQIHKVSSLMEKWHIIMNHNDEINRTLYLSSGVEYLQIQTIDSEGEVMSEGYNQEYSVDFDAKTAYQINGMESLVETADYVATDVVERDGAEFIRYVADDVEYVRPNNPVYAISPDPDVGEIFEFHAEYLVDKDSGIITDVMVEVKGSYGEDRYFYMELSLGYSDLSATDVEEPAWVDEEF